MIGPGLAYVAEPTHPGPAVLILHSWWGLTNSFTDYADKLAGEGFLAGCVDLYDGGLATTPEEAAALRAAPRSRPMYRTMLAALDELSADPAARRSRVGLVGFSMGGHWAVWLAQRADVPAGAVVVHYATRAVKTSDPVPVLAHFAEHDPFVTKSGRSAMERSLRLHGWPYTAHDYPGTGHWFAESGEGAYDPGPATAAFARTSRFLAEALDP